MSKVRSITLDSWEPELLKVMTELGNERVNHIFEAVVGDDYTRPVHSSPRLTLSAVCAQCSLNDTSVLSHAKHHTTTVLQPFFRDHPGEPVPEENFWTLWCKGRLAEADTLTIWLGATPSGLTSAHFHHPPIFFTGRMPFLPPNQQHQSTEGK